jgi:serine phosphatase RsbU (regulator of sigma subunit)
MNRGGCGEALLRMRSRLVLLLLLGVLMTLSVAGAALVSLADVSAINRELAQVNRALHYHQRVDMMHDALHADAARAQLAGLDRAGFAKGDVRRNTQRHAARFRSDLEALESVQLPARIESAIENVRPVQDLYVDAAQSMVDAALAGEPNVLADQVSYDATYKVLIPRQAAVTKRLMDLSEDVTTAATTEKAEAQRVVTIATGLALAGWLALAAWHNHSINRLQGALVREAEQRSAADLLQRSLLPTHLPPVPGASLAARSVPGGHGQRVGGDWYDVFDLPTGQVCLVVGDVVGHDLPAATVMGQLRNTLRAYALEDSDPAGILRRVNRAACLLDASDLTTCICAIFDPATRRLRWASAGHLPPLKSSAAGVGNLLRGEAGPPVGVLPEADYPLHQTTLDPGASLLFYSDGLVERRGRAIDSGLEILEALSMPHADPSELCDKLLATFHADDSDHPDDVTLLLLQTELTSMVPATGHSIRPVECRPTFQR